MFILAVQSQKLNCYLIALIISKKVDGYFKLGEDMGSWVEIQDEEEIKRLKFFWI